MPDPTTTANKVCFGLKNVYYAKLSWSGDTPSFGTPVKLAGGVNLNLSAQGEVTKFYADDIVFYQSVGNAGYEGDLELARVSDAFLKDIFGLTEGSTSKVLTENANVEPAEFALLFQVGGNSDSELHVLYRCTAGRPAIASGTVQTTKEPVTQSMTISAVPLPNGNIRARTQHDTPTATRTGWFTTVFVES